MRVQVSPLVPTLRGNVRNTLASQLHEAYKIITKIEDFMCEIFEKYEPELYNKGFDFDIASDPYDNSLEVYFKSEMPEYPWEPGIEIRQEIYSLGFDVVYWNFVNEEFGWELKTDKGFFKFSKDEEIRGFEPRRFKNFFPKDLGMGVGFNHIHVPGIGYVDNRFDKKVWINSKYDCRKLKKN